ncbi:MAG: flagellar basal body L-ring protein FlgH [Phycisphaerae bacterium]|nr:flagellar basal body L-ring protein FlgH [Phycisphaerae bacterium]
MTRLFVWLMRALLVLGVCLAVVRPNAAKAQSSSLFIRASASTPGLAVRPAVPVEEEDQEGMPALVENSFFSVKPPPKRIFKVGDLITVIVRQKSEYKHSGDTKLEREVEIQAALKDWIRFSDAGSSCKLVPDTMPAGDPKIDFKMDRSFEGNGGASRKDEVITRITCRIIDVMPNKNLVLQGGPDVVETDDEKQVVTLTGTCRTDDIAADNTILSTQLLETHFKRESFGPVRDSMRRGWAYKIWDKIRPF